MEGSGAYPKSLAAPWFFCGFVFLFLFERNAGRISTVGVVEVEMEEERGVVVGQMHMAGLGTSLLNITCDFSRHFERCL